MSEMLTSYREIEFRRETKFQDSFRVNETESMTFQSENNET
jgi:hypothetical protein